MKTTFYGCYAKKQSGQHNLAFEDGTRIIITDVAAQYSHSLLRKRLSYLSFILFIVFLNTIIQRYVSCFCFYNVLSSHLSFSFFYQFDQDMVQFLQEYMCCLCHKDLHVQI